MQTNNLESLNKAKIARTWQGRTADAKANEYEKYLSEEGVKKLAGIEGNLGVQMMRRWTETLNLQLFRIGRAAKI